MGNIFFGSYPRNLDEKGRLLLPSALFGKEAPTSLYILRGFDGCLSVYLEDRFQELLSELSSLNQRDPGDRAYLRIVSASMKQLKVDAHGRVLLGVDTLHEYGLGNEVLVNGAIDHIEIWDKAAFDAYRLHNGSGIDFTVGRS